MRDRRRYARTFSSLYIAPYEGFHPPYKNHEVREVVKLFTVPRVPNDAEKERVDREVNDLIMRGLPDWFFVENISEDQHFPIYAKKFLVRTWKNLEKHSLATSARNKFATSHALGFAIMSILADSLAATERRLITDETVSYSCLNRYLLTIGGGELGNFDEKTRAVSDYFIKNHEPRKRQPKKTGATQRKGEVGKR